MAAAHHTMPLDEATASPVAMCDGRALGPAAWYALLTTVVAGPLFVAAPHPGVATVALLAGTGAAVHQLSLGLPGEFWAHALIGIMLAGCASPALSGDGGPVAVSKWQGGLGAAAFALLLFGEFCHHGPSSCSPVKSVHMLAHVAIEAAAGSFALLAMLAAIATERRWTRAAARLSTMRRLHDPIALAVLGHILTQHQHDPQPIAVLFHITQGRSMLALGLCSVVCSVAHDAGVPVAAGTTLRLLTATLWLLNGLWLVHMAAFMYLLPGRCGLHQLLWPSANADEAATVYLATDAWLSAVAVCVAYWLGEPTRAKVADEQSGWATVEDKQLAVGARTAAAEERQALVEMGRQADGLAVA